MSDRERYESIEWLHLFAQFHWHDDASIVGTRKGVEALRDALNTALAHPDGVAQAQGMTNDGEGYPVNVYVVPFGEFERMQLPYTDTELCGPMAGRLWPHQLPRKPTGPRQGGVD